MCASGRSRFQIDGARGCVIGGDPKWQSRRQLFIFFVLVFVLQIVVIFLIAWFADWLGRILGSSFMLWSSSLGYERLIFTLHHGVLVLTPGQHFRLSPLPRGAHLGVASHGAEEAGACDRHHQCADRAPGAGDPQSLIAEQGPLNAEAPAFPLATQAAIPLRTNADKQGSGDFSSFWSGKLVRSGRHECRGPDAHDLRREPRFVAQPIGSEA